KSDEAIQLRANSQLQALNTSKKQVPPRRKTRASMGAIVNTGARTIEIPLDPIPMAEVPEPSTESTSQPLLSAAPRLAEVFDGDIDKLDKVLNDFAQLCLGRDAVVTVTPKKGTTAKKKSGSAKKKQDKPFMINYVHPYIHPLKSLIMLRSQRRLRHFTCMKFEVEVVGDFDHHNPASEASVSACEAGEDPPDELFQWDFSPGYLQCRWNKLMIKKIVDILLAEHEEDQEDFIEVGANRVFMENAMKDKLATWRGSWHKFQPRFSSATQHVETLAEAHARAVQAKEQHQLEMRSLALKTRKLGDRIETSTHTIALKILAGTARDVETWKRMRDMVGHLGIWGMSSEEEADVMLDGQLVRIYKVKVCIWREPSIADYLRFVDAQTAMNKKNQPGPKPAPRVRNPQHGFGTAAAPPGLPRNLYSSTWLDSKTPAYIETLNIPKEVFELFRAMESSHSTGSPTFPVRIQIRSAMLFNPAQTLAQTGPYFDGFIKNKLGVFGAHYGDPNFLLDIPPPSEATAPDGYKLNDGDFRRPLWINPKFPYLVLLPRFSPFNGPLFSRLNVNEKTVPIVEVTVPGSSFGQFNIRWGLDQKVVDSWLYLESLLRLTLRTMMDLYGSRPGEAVYTFLSPISYCYTERNATSHSNAVKIALRSRDAFLPLMAEITVMFILLDARDTQDWRRRLMDRTKLNWQWIVDLEQSAVGNMHIDRLGGIMDLTLRKTHMDHHLPRHARWLLPHLLGRHRVPLYFFYGNDLPLKEPIPDALINLDGEVVFSRWSATGSKWQSLRNGLPPTTTSARLQAKVQQSEMPSAPPPASTPFPAVERDSGQKPGEDVHAFLERRRLHNEKRAQHESFDARKARLAREQHASGGSAPGKKGARVFIWEEDGGFFIRRACNRTDAADRWDEFTPRQRLYDSFSNQWDLCTALAPTEIAEPDNFDDDDGDEDDFFFH
ncbi:hypothetical protein R3P38DRAFT_2572320, partial [Favolaschia claudopus]